MTSEPSDRPAKVTAFVSHFDCSRHDTGWGHPEHQGRLPALMREVYRDMLTLFDPLLEFEGRHATEDELLLAHEPEYLEQVRGWVERAVEVGRPTEVRPGLVVSSATWDASLAAVGSAIAALDVVLSGTVRNAFCAARPPARDAIANSPGRFGCLNPIACTARHALERGLGRVLLVEWGGPLELTAAAAFPEDGAVRFVRIGAAPDSATTGDLPGKVALAPGTGGPGFLSGLRGALKAATDGFTPDLVLLSAGFDGLGTDPLGDLDLSPRDYFDATLLVRDLADAFCDGRLVSILEGGYDPPGVGKAAVQHLRALAGLPAAD